MTQRVFAGKPRIAVPVPTGSDHEYNRCSWPQYAAAIELCGGLAVEIPLDAADRELQGLMDGCAGVVLPGSPSDVDPKRYGQTPIPECAPPDPARERVEGALLTDAFDRGKPVLAICFGTQFLNVWLGGTLVQDLAVLPVNHAAGRSVAIAHTAAVARPSLLSDLLDDADAPEQDGFLRLPINSSHHQAIGIVGAGLAVVARCPQDAVVEAVAGLGEGKVAGHFVLGVQWHPERSVDQSHASRAIFTRLIHEASLWAGSHEPDPV